MSWLRTIGSFLYSMLLCAGFFFLSIWILARSIVYSEGFTGTLCAILFIAFILGWVSEKGVVFASVLFNWLWDESLKTRLASMIVAIMIGLWCISSPFRISLHFTFGDWVIILVWEISVLAFYYNMFTLPLLNKNMGIKNF